MTNEYHIMIKKAHCFFEQSGTFKNAFKYYGIDAEDYDIQNNFGETDNVIDLFAEIKKGYDGKPSVFDRIENDDLIMAFFPCIYFECLSMIAFSWGNRNYRKLTRAEATDKIIERENNRHEFYILLLKLVKVVTERGLRMILENPWSMQHYLKQGNFVKSPDLVDTNRMKRGDNFVKPTAYWFFNCSPTYNESMQHDKKKLLIQDMKSAPRAGLCSQDRSMISPDYALNFIDDFLLGGGHRKGIMQQTELF